MTWMAPWAWLGLGTLVLPVLVHLLARGRAPLRRLPTLRFVEAAQPVAVRRTRLRDPLLLFVRLLVLLVAVAALARPHLPARLPAVAPGGEPPVTRVILVDASPGMDRPVPGGSTALEEARRRAREEAGREAGRGAVPGGSAEGGMGSGLLFQGTAGPARPGATYLLEVDGGGDALAQAMVGAEAFLEGLSGLREVVVFSDFQVGTLPAVQASSRGRAPALPGEGIGVRLETIAVDPTMALERVIRHPASETRVSVRATAEGIRADWIRASPAGAPPTGAPTGAGPDAVPGSAPGSIPGSAPGPGAAFPVRLAERAGLPAPSAEHPVEIRVLPGAALGGEPAGALAGPLPEGRPWSEAPGWMADVALAVARDPVLEAVAAAHPPSGALHPSAAGSYLPLVRSRTGEPVVVAAPVGTDRSPTGGTEAETEAGTEARTDTGADAGTTGSLTLMLGIHGPPESLLAAALVAAVAQATPDAGSSAAWDPQVLADADLEVWRRQAVVRPPDPGGAGEGADLARLLWLGVLLLLGLEWGVRRRRPGDSADPQGAEGTP